jgi:hypothetical protein
MPGFTVAGRGVDTDAQSRSTVGPRSETDRQGEEGLCLELSGLEEVFLLQVVGRHLRGGVTVPPKYTHNLESCLGAVTFWGCLGQDGAAGGIFSFDRDLTDTSGIVDFWTHIVSRRQHTTAGVRGDDHRRHRRLLLLLEARIVAEQARQIVGNSPEFSTYEFTRDIASTSGLLEVERQGVQSYKVWVFMGYVPQLRDSERGLLAELSADEGPAWALASVLRDIQRETIEGEDRLGYWTQRRIEEIRHEERDEDLEYWEENDEEIKDEEVPVDKQEEEETVETEEEVSGEEVLEDEVVTETSGEVTSFGI